MFKNVIGPDFTESSCSVHSHLVVVFAPTFVFHSGGAFILTTRRLLILTSFTQGVTATSPSPSSTNTTQGSQPKCHAIRATHTQTSERARCQRVQHTGSHAKHRGTNCTRLQEKKPYKISVRKDSMRLIQQSGDQSRERCHHSRGTHQGPP